MDQTDSDPFQELVDAMRRVLSQTTTPPAPAPTSDPAPSISSSTPIYPASHMVNPVPSSGLVEECNGFIMQCSLVLEMQPHRFPTERAKIAYVLTLLTGRVLQWAESFWHQNGPATQSLEAFFSNFPEVFGWPVGHASIGEQLYHLKQGQKSIQEYGLRFCTFAASSGWNERSLLTAYHQGLEPSLRLHLFTYDDTMGLEHFLQHRLTQGLCLYCGKDRHVIRACRIRPP